MISKGSEGALCRRWPVRDAVADVPTQARVSRPSSGTWSVTEYVCHLRDVYVTYTIRLHRARTEHRSTLEPMLNDLRARRFRYNEHDVNVVLDELAATAGGFAKRSTTPAQMTGTV